jgi:transcriptional regulator with XRE-family HTH domain
MTAGRRDDDEAEGADWSSDALGAFIRGQRQLAKLSLREMASMTRVSNAYLSQVERGLHQPSLKVLHSIADALHLTTEQMLEHAGWGLGEPSEPGPERTAPRSAPAAGCSVEDAVRAEDRLTEEQKNALLGVYRSFLAS